MVKNASKYEEHVVAAVEAWRTSGGDVHKMAADLNPPSIIEMLNLAQSVMDKGGAATNKKKECSQIRKKALGIHKNFRNVAKLRDDLKRALGQEVCSVQTPLNNAEQLIDTYGAANWVESKFKDKNVFEDTYTNLLNDLEKGDSRLAVAVKTVKDGTYTDAGVAPTESGLSEDALKAYDEVAKRLSRLLQSTHSSADLVVEAKAERDAEHEDEIEEHAGDEAEPEGDHDISPSEAVKKELQEGRKGTKADTVLGQAFVGNFWESIDRYEAAGPEPGDADDLDKTGQTYAALHQAVFWGDLEGVVLFTSRGADVNIKTQQRCPVLGVPEGTTPLHLAATIGNLILVRQLICDGANVDETDDEDKTAYDRAGTQQCQDALTTEAIAYLRARQARFEEFIKAGDWKEAMKLVDGGLPANALLPADPDAGVHDKYHAIQRAATTGNLAAYLQLVCAGALPIQRKSDEEVDSLESAKDPSNCRTEDDAFKALLQDIERRCREPAGAAGP